MNPTPIAEIGFVHFLQQADGLGKTLLVVLLVMSLASWSTVALKALAQWRQRRRGDTFLAAFRTAVSADEARQVLKHGSAMTDPFSRLATEAMQAQCSRRRHAAGAAASPDLADFITRTLRKGLDDELLQRERGLTLLATVGVTAPFVGLLGTVWGVYHALVAIGLSGASTLDKVAGPVGEALIMTGLGLAVAIPAVVAYNAFTRANRVWATRLDGFAYEVHSLLTLGTEAASPPADAPAAVTTLKPLAAAVAANG